MTETPEHVPEVSLWPIMLAAGITLLVIGIITSFIVSILGLLLLFFSIAGWTQENRAISRRAEEQERERLEDSKENQEVMHG